MRKKGVDWGKEKKKRIRKGLEEGIWERYRIKRERVEKEEMREISGRKNEDWKKKGIRLEKDKEEGGCKR